MRIIVLIVIAFLLCPILNAQKADSLENKNDYILILNSHNYDNAWSTSVSKSIRHEIERQCPNIVVSISYAGVTNRTSFLSGRFGMQAAFATGRIKNIAPIPKVLILVGDESWMYYRIMNLRGVWEKVPVVLFGVRPEIMDDFSKFHSAKTISDSLLIPLDKSRNNLPITAVVERENEAYTVWLMKQLMPDLKQLVFLSKGSYQDKYALNVLQKVIDVQYPELNLNVIHSEEKSAELVQHELSNLPKNTAILLGSAGCPQKVNAPVFVLNDRKFEGKNIVGGYYPSKENYVLQVSDIALRVYNGEAPDSIPFSYIKGEKPHLNTMALEYFGLKGKAKPVPDVLYSNIPTPFYVKHTRVILIFSIAALVLIIITLLNYREKRYRAQIMRSMEKYKKIYDEYQIVYENMPMGLAFFDKNGDLLNRNQSSDLFFDKVSDDKKDDFNLFRSDMLDVQSKMKISKKLLVNKVFDYDDRSLRLIFRHIQDEESDSENILMIVLDYTNIQKEKTAKERVYSIFNLAMDTSSLGVAEYNLVDNSRFATDAWYKNLCVDREENFSTIHRAVVEEDRKKIEDFLANIGEDGEVYFAETVRVKDGDMEHWLQYIIQLLEYGPEEGRVIVAELVLNVDKQKSGEQELNQALEAAKEADRLKNAFIANMSSDIRPALDELVVLSTRLIETGDEDEKESLMVKIEQNNDLLLRYVERIIELSRTDVTKNIDL